MVTINDSNFVGITEYRYHVESKQWRVTLRYRDQDNKIRTRTFSLFYSDWLNYNPDCWQEATAKTVNKTESYEIDVLLLIPPSPYRRLSFCIDDV